MPKPLRIILLGTGPFAVPAFDAIRAGGDCISMVVTKPIPLPIGKPRQPSSPVFDWANRFSLPIFQPTSINASDAIDRIANDQADLLFVCDYGQILSREVLATSRLGGINLHGSLLPRHRGAAPVQWAILSGDALSGITVIHMTPRLDGGPILTTRSVAIYKNETAAQLEPRLSQLGVDAVLNAVEFLRKCDTLDDALPLGKFQDANLVTHARRLKKRDGQLDFRYPVKTIDRQFRGLQPWPGVFGELNLNDGKQLRVIVCDAKPLDELYVSEGYPTGALLWGDALSNFRTAKLAVVCNPGLLEILSIQPSGKRAMSADEFLRGYGRNQSPTFESLQAEHPLMSQLGSNESIP